MKNLLFPLCMFAAALSSCSNDDVDTTYNGSVDSDDLVGINVYALTPSTKGTDTTTATLQDKKYVELHIDDSGNISKTYTFIYSGSDWGQEDDSKITWDKITFPANFYSFNDGTALTSTDFDNVDATIDYTVSGNSTAHNDLVYHASKLSTMPSGGSVSVYHKHALSKINIYANTGTNNVYVARARLVYVDSDGTVTITPLSADEISTANGASWELDTFNAATYLYHYIGDNSPEKLTSTTTSDPLINSATNAPLMIIPQTTVAATITGTDGLEASISSNTYVELIYYMTDVYDIPVVGYSSIAAHPNASEYMSYDQPLYVMAGFPLGHTFAVNMEYDLKLGLGGENTTGGILIKDNYVDKDGEVITLTMNDGCETTETPEIDEIDDGDPILGGSTDNISIVVTAGSWSDGGVKVLEDSSVN